MLQDSSRDSPREAFSKEGRLSTQGGLGRGQVESPGCIRETSYVLNSYRFATPGGPFGDSGFEGF